MTKLINQTKAQSEVNSASHDLDTEYNIYNIYFLYRFIHFIMVKVMRSPEKEREGIMIII